MRSSSARGSLKDLALALFVGMAAGAYSSIFIATPLLAQLKASESEVQLAEKRARAAQRREADRYAAVPPFTEDMPIQAEPGAAARAAPAEAPASGTPAPRRSPEAAGRGRVAPPSPRPGAPSGASGRQQPPAAEQSKRGKK